MSRNSLTGAGGHTYIYFFVRSFRFITYLFIYMYVCMYVVTCVSVVVGSIPEQLGNLRLLTKLNMGSNKLSG